MRAVALAVGIALSCQVQAQQAEVPEAAVEEVQTLRTDVPQWVLDGSALLTAGKAEEAAALFEQLLAAEPGNAPARYWLGEAYLALGQKNKARAAFAASLKADPKHPFAVDARIRLADSSIDSVAESPQVFPRRGPNSGTVPSARRWSWSRRAHS